MRWISICLLPSNLWCKCPVCSFPSFLPSYVSSISPWSVIDIIIIQCIPSPIFVIQVFPHPFMPLFFSGCFTWGSETRWHRLFCLFLYQMYSIDKSSVENLISSCSMDYILQINNRNHSCNYFAPGDGFMGCMSLINFFFSQDYYCIVIPM